MTQQPHSFLWLDYETTGTRRAHDRPVQFGAVRTDAELQQIEEPILLECAISKDCLPSPSACLVHGVGPLTQNRTGTIEAEFARQVYQLTTQRGTCNVGYNNIRFDDEFSRHLFFRNLHEPYAFHSRSGCTRWDLLDVARACRALAPQGLQWPWYEDGERASYRLGDIARANGIELQEHNALEDAVATLKVAQLIRSAQPKFFDWALQMRERRFVEKHLNGGEPLVLVSGLMPAQQRHAALVLPLGECPGRARSWMVAHLNEPDEQFEPQLLAQRFEPNEDGRVRPPVSLVQSNRCPFLAPVSVLRDGRAEALGIDVAEQLKRAERLLAQGDLPQRVAQHYAPQERASETNSTEHDPDDSLYRGNFASAADRRILNAMHKGVAPQDMLQAAEQLGDALYSELVYRYVARNWPQALTDEQQQQWRQQCAQRLQQGPARTLEQYRSELQEVQSSAPEQLLQELQQWERQVLDWLEQ